MATLPKGLINRPISNRQGCCTSSQNSGYAGLTADAPGNLFGTTAYASAYGGGTVFEIAKTSTGYAGTPTTLVNFYGTNGLYPFSLGALRIEHLESPQRFHRGVKRVMACPCAIRLVEGQGCQYAVAEKFQYFTATRAQCSGDDLENVVQ